MHDGLKIVKKNKNHFLFVNIFVNFRLYLSENCETQWLLVKSSFLK